MFVPCSPRHRQCSPAHADLVRSYRDERHRQEIVWEGMTGGWAGDAKHLRGKGYSLITFSDWLRGHKRGTP